MLWKLCLNNCALSLKMSQSDLHKRLVVQVADKIKTRYPEISIVTDIQQAPNDTVPPMIKGFRPDVYATMPTGSIPVVIAEAKTDFDIENKHTEQQVSAFIDYLEQMPKGVFIMAVTGHMANRSKTFLRFFRQANPAIRTTLSVFDSHDLWTLAPMPSPIWHLS